MSPDVLYQLRSYADQLDEQAASYEEVAAPPTPVRRGEEPRQRRSRRGWAIAVAAAVITILVVAVPLLLLGGGSEDAPVVTQPAPEPTIPPPTTEAAAMTGFTPDSWQRVGSDVMQPVVGLFDMTLAGSRLVAVGFDPGENFRQDGVIFVSDDGTTWTRLAEDDAALTTGAVLMYGIAEGGPGLVAVGMGCENEAEGCAPYATAWTSTDGTSWARTPYDADVFGDSATQTSAMLDVIDTGGGLVAVGAMEYWTVDEAGAEEGVTVYPAVWTSPDGVSWERSWEGAGVDVELATYGEVNVSMEAVTEGDFGGLVAVGSTLDEAGESIAAAWKSDDGKTWDRVPHDPSIFAGDHGLTMWDVAAGESGFVAVGGEGLPAQPAVWTSPDGLTWARIELDESEFNGSLSSVAALDTGFVAAGPHGFADQSEEPVTLWTSPDGFTWDRVLTLGAGQAQAVAVTDAAIAVAGGLPEDNDFHAAVWTGPAFDPNAPPPEPPLPPPTTVEEETSTGTSGVGPLAEGLLCEDISTLGYSYAEAVTYWTRYGMPSALDTDGNGVPCEDDYPPSEVAGVFGGPEAMSVVLLSDLTGPDTFTATGPAVDSGLMCPSGTIEFTGEVPPTRDAALFRWEDVHTCDDGSGAFILGADVFIEAGNREYGVWSVASGTGNYESLWGAGGVGTLFDEDLGLFTGKVDLVVAEPLSLYADGSVECPGADDLSTPVGTVVLEPVPDGVSFEVVLADAAPDWDYYVVLSQPSSGEYCIGEIQQFDGFRTDETGSGVFTGTYATPPGTYLLLVDVVASEAVPPNPKHREIATAGFVEITVP